MKKILLIITFTLSPTFCFAFFCPTNFNQINFGDSIDQVTQQCGKPDSQQETKKENDNIPQQWTYYVTQAVSVNMYNVQTQGTLKTEVTFDASGKAININVNGIAVGASTICGNNSIQLNDTKEAIKAACGDPAFINKQAPPGEPPKPPQRITTFIYNSNPPAKLIFENGKLTERK